MLKDTKSLGNNKAPACESRGFVRKKQKVCILTHLLFLCPFIELVMKYFSNFEHSLYNKESMDIIQVIIFIIIIVAAIVQQISKTGKEKKTPSPKKVLADIFPEIEQENIEEDLPVSSVQTVRTPQTPRMQHQPMVKKPTDSPRKENKREDRTPIRLSTKEEARRAFIYSEIFNRKY